MGNDRKTQSGIRHHPVVAAIERKRDQTAQLLTQFAPIGTPMKFMQLLTGLMLGLTVTAPSLADVPTHEVSILATPQVEQAQLANPSAATRLETLAHQINQTARGQQSDREAEALEESLREQLGLPNNPVIIETMGDYAIGVEL